MSTKEPHQLPIRAGRGLVSLLTAVPLVVAGFAAGYGLGGDRNLQTLPALGGTDVHVVEHAPVAASYTATGLTGHAPQAPSVLPVGTTEGLGISVTHLQFTVDESTVRSEHSAELRLPILVAPDAEDMMIEVSSVRPVACLCSLTAETAPPYGRVWDVAHVNAATTEVVFDVSGAITAPGRYGFAVSTPDLDHYLEFSGMPLRDRPVLRTATPIPAPAETPPGMTPAPPGAATAPPAGPSPDPSLAPAPLAEPEPDPATVPVPGPNPSAAVPAPVTESGQAAGNLGTCRTGPKLVPTCGALVGAAAGAHTNLPKEEAFLDFEQDAGRAQHIYHAYERGDARLFPTPEQLALTQDPAHPRTLFINWKPQIATWAEIADGDPAVDAYLSELAAHITDVYDRPFYFTVHHEPENDVIQEPGSGMEAADYADMFRYVVNYLRAEGADNLVTVMNYMGYLKWVAMPWHDQLYPGDDVVDWIGLSGYGQSLADKGYSDFTEIIDQTDDTTWPGFYHWAGRHHPDKPMMLAEWGVFNEEDYPRHQETVFRTAAEQLAHYPRLKAIVYFSSPDAEGRNSEITVDPDAQRAFGDLMRSKYFDVRLE